MLLSDLTPKYYQILTQSISESVILFDLYLIKYTLCRICVFLNAIWEGADEMSPAY